MQEEQPSQQPLPAQPEQQKLPNATTSIVLGVISFFCCLISSGIGGIIFSGIALYLSNRDRKLYIDSPADYYNYNQVKTARTIAIIGLALAILTIIAAIIVIYSFGGWEAYKEYIENMMEEIQEG